MHSYKNLIVSIIGGLFIVWFLQSALAKQPRIILVTGFEPFGGDITNGSWEAVQHLNGKRFGNATVIVAQLPVVWGKAAEKLREHVKTNKPVAIISFGQAGDDPVQLETTAHNVRENILDNKKMLPQSLQIYSRAAPVLKTGLPLPEIQARLHTAGIPVRVSQNAGTYLCNEIFYTLMHDPGIEDIKKIPRGFIHVPPLNAKVLTRQGKRVIFDKTLLEKTAEIIIQTVADQSIMK